MRILLGFCGYLRDSLWYHYYMEAPKELQNPIENAGQFTSPGEDRMNDLHPYGIEEIDEAHRLAEINQHIADIHGGNGMQQNIDGPVLPDARSYEPQTLGDNSLKQTHKIKQDSTEIHALHEIGEGILEAAKALAQPWKFFGRPHAYTTTVQDVHYLTGKEPGTLNSSSSNMTESREASTSVSAEVPNNIVPFKVREEEVARAA